MGRPSSSFTDMRALPHAFADILGSHTVSASRASFRSTATAVIGRDEAGAGLR
jgi:hypothetical protein